MFTAVFNYIIAPLLGAFGVSVPVLELPPAYYTLAGSIVWGLLGKKAWDATDLQWGSFEKRPKAPTEEPARAPAPTASRREKSGNSALSWTVPYSTAFPRCICLKTCSSYN